MRGLYQRRLRSVGHRRWLSGLHLVVFCCALFVLLPGTQKALAFHRIDHVVHMISGQNGAHAISRASVQIASTPPASVKVWVQTLAACQRALPGAVYMLEGNGLFVVQGPGLGDVLALRRPGPCLRSHSDCVATMTGCVSWDLPVPVRGTETYTITEVVAPHGYEPCLYRAGCRTAQENITLIVDASGKVAAVTQIPESNGVVKTIPGNQGSFSATQADPALFFNSQSLIHSCCCDCCGCSRHWTTPIIRNEEIIPPDGQEADDPSDLAASQVARGALSNAPVVSTIASSALTDG